MIKDILDKLIENKTIANYEIIDSNCQRTLVYLNNKTKKIAIFNSYFNSNKLNFKLNLIYKPKIKL